MIYLPPISAILKRKFRHISFKRSSILKPNQITLITAGGLHLPSSKLIYDQIKVKGKPTNKHSKMTKNYEVL